MPRKRRADNRGYPTGWTWHHNAIYYMVPAGMESRWDGKRKFRLGGNEAEAYKTWARRIESPDVPTTIGPGLDKFLLEVVPDLSPSTQEYYRAAIKELRPVFGHMGITEFDHTHAYQYRNRRKKSVPNPAGPEHPPIQVIAKKSANRGMEVMSTFFTKCFEWGVPGLTVHPMMEGKFRKHSIPARDRIVEDWEIVEALSLKPSKYGRSAIPMCQAYLRLKLVSARRRIEILRLKTTDLLDTGVRWTLAKSKQSGIKHLITEWSPELRSAIDAALSARPIGKKPSKNALSKPADISPWVFCKWDGTPYLKEDGTESEAFGSAWARFMDNLIETTEIKERFWDSDLRAKASMDVGDVDRAQKLLAHTSGATTRKHYRRKPETVKPVK